MSLTLLLNYFNSFSEFQTTNPDSPISKETYEDYVNTGNNVDKLIVQEGARILRTFTHVENVSFNIEWNGIHHSTEVNRADHNEFLGFRIEHTSNEDNS
ncbi:hypothetical protein Q0N12_02865 [Rossellomorea marisflavi]|uniref:hypothetical protein n=1 Tax=Rossellomorea marisflavi TaxID=189381 RepID=UPI003459C44F